MCKTIQISYVFFSFENYFVFNIKTNEIFWLSTFRFSRSITGCYQISTLSTKQQKDDLMVHNNTVGNCYWECKMKAMRSNPCGNNADVLFGLHVGLKVFLLY